MYARAVDDASIRLRELRREKWEELGLGTLALGLAVAATAVHPELAWPLFAGGVAVGTLGLRALWRQWDLVERLAGERDAYVIPEVRDFAAREGTMERRHGYAELIRSWLARPGVTLESRISASAEELEALVAELDDDQLTLDPACAVACTRLLFDFAESPLLDPERPAAELRSRVRQIRSGFEPARRPA